MHDVRLVIRALRATPLVSAVAVLSLALGIGTNTAIFSLVDTLLLRPLPVREPQRLAIVSGGGSPSRAYPYATWEAMRARAGAFEGMCAWFPTRVDVAQGGEMHLIDGLYASGDFFALLGVPALLGRTFAPADDVRGGGPDGAVAVISHAFWQRRFGGVPTVIGTPIVLERVPFTIIGVTPPSFRGPEVGRGFDVAIPVTSDALLRGRETFLDRRGSWYLTVMLRLKLGQSLDAATAALRGMQPQIRDEALPHELPAASQAAFLKDPLTLLPAASGTSALRQRYELPLLALFAVVGTVLLIACANVANLELARAAARRHEFSVRLALGAARWQLARQLFVESAILAAIGAGAGLLFARWASRALVAQLSLQFFNPVTLDVTVDWRVLAFTSAVMIVTAVLFAVAPAVCATRVTPNAALTERGLGLGGGDIPRVGVSSVLLVVQVALTLALVVSSGLFVRTFARMASIPLGFESDPVVVVNIDVRRAQVAAADRVALFERLTRAVGAVPGVARASGSLMTPVSGAFALRAVNDPRAPAAPPAQRLSAYNFVTPGWLAVYGTPLKAGRDFTDRDVKNDPPVAIVNEAFVRRFLPGQTALGATFLAQVPGSREGPKAMTVIGIAADAVYRPLRDPVPPTMYMPLAQWDLLVPFGGGSVSVRAAQGSPAGLERAIAAALTGIDPNLAFEFHPLADQVSASFAQERLIAILAGFFGALAMLLACLGLYGVTTYAILRRYKEIGIRLALGAKPAGIIRLVLSRVTILVACGLVIGTAASLWASKFVASLLFGLEPRDPATLAGAAAVLAAVGAIAGGLPAWRASRTDPVAVLREN